MPLASGLPKHVADEESLARHIFQKQHLRKVDEGFQPKAQAFMPLKDEHGEYVISVTRLQKFQNDDAIERNGVDVGCMAPSPRVLVGFTKLVAKQIRTIPVHDKDRKLVGRMDVVAEEPPPHHAHIIKFPDQVEGENPKLLQKECAEELAAIASVVQLRTLPPEEREKQRS